VLPGAVCSAAFRPLGAGAFCWGYYFFLLTAELRRYAVGRQDRAGV